MLKKPRRAGLLFLVILMAMRRQNLGEMLVAANLIDEVQMQVALAEQQRTGKRFGSSLVELKFIDENVLAAFLSKQIDIPCISLLRIDIPKKVRRLIDRDTAINCQCIPVRVEEGKLEAAMVDPTDIETLAKLEAAAGMTVVPLIAPESSILQLIERFYPLEADPDSTQGAAVRPSGDAPAPSNPMFWDLIEELDNADLDRRLTRIEQNIERVWVLLEKVLRMLETRV